MTDLPTGTVTFLFTDLEGSTRLWEQHPEAMRDALARHDEILRDAVEKRGAATLAAVPALLQAGMSEMAATVLGAVDAGVIWTFEASGYGIFDAAEMAPQVEAAAGAGAYADAYTRGRAMSYDDAVAFLRAGLDAIRTEAGTAPV